MSSQPLIIEGLWQDVVEISVRYADRRVRLIVLPPRVETPDIFAAPSIEEEIAAIWSDVTKEQWSSLPSDLSDQIDHYVYGTPKQ